MFLALASGPIAAKMQSGMADYGYRWWCNGMILSQWADTQTRQITASQRRKRRLLLGNGLTAEAVAKQFNISREDQDEFACQLTSKALKTHLKSKLTNKWCRYRGTDFHQ
jgi:acetyl-CoA acyltransferase